MNVPLSPQSSVLITDAWWLLALPLLAGLLVVARLPWWRAARQAGRPAMHQEGRRLAFRFVWLALLVLALAGATLNRPLHRQAIIFVTDTSASVAPIRDQTEGIVRAALTQLPAGDMAGVVAVADSARVEEMIAESPAFSRLSTVLPVGASDLAAGLRLAGAMVPEGYSGRVVLISDGRQTRGDAVAAARELMARDVTVDVLPVGADSADVRLEHLGLPETAYRGEVSTLLARLYAGQATEVTIRVYGDDALLLERSVALRSGRQELAFPLPVGEPGLHRYRIDVSAADPTADASRVNNVLGAVQRVAGPPKVLVVATDPAAAGLLPAALQASGAEVTVTNPASMPADLAGWSRYAAAVLADIRAESLPSGAMDLIEQYVRDLGRGLVMTGGPDSFGPGGYADTPVERTLPVYMDVRGRGRQPQVALALVVDKSGSMGGTKIELAKEAAVRSIGLLRPDDRAAILAFDSVPQWVAPLTPLTERSRLEQAIGSIYAGGGTEIYPALAAGFAALRDVEADVKHVILMTDGHSGSDGDYAGLLEQMRAARVSLSTVAVGGDADGTLLQAMARIGRGRYHFADDPASIPQIFARETIMATRSILVDARFYPAAASSGPLLRGMSAVPPLDGYVAVTPKERAEVVLVSPEGDPVLAAWQYGIGRAIAWTPDLTNRWSGAWIDNPTATSLWGNVLSWLLPPQEDGELAVRVEAEGDDGFAVVAENRAGWDQVRPTRAAILGPNGARQELELAPGGPGRYRAQVEPPEPGAYVVRVTQTIDDGAELHGEAGWAAPYPPEYRETGRDQALVTRMAAAGGGRVLREPGEAVRPADRPAVARWPLAPLLLILAALLWPLEIASRRLILPSVATRLPFRRHQAQATGSGPKLTAAPRPSEVAAKTPPAQTAERLLERKRSFRARRK
ncbi:MAG: VWA domain-containing protein [Chloroflexota bacterium]|nr:MAG: VWA domain-containing protein [Chloroflexota bacterium]